MPTNISPSSRPGASGSGKSPLVLVVEDEPLLRITLAITLADSLEQGGFSVIESSHAEEALLVLEAGVPVDLVFSDVNMPGDMNGLGLAEWVHTHRPDVPVILTSGVPQMVAEAEALCDGHETVIPKPYNLNDVKRKIRRSLS
jgi:DNA-binding NtrC family response regulator